MTKYEKFSHYAVVVIALAAVVLSAWQASLSREHNRLSVRPYLDTFTSWVEDGQWSIQVSNDGIGPAVITNVTYTYDGKSYKGWDPVLDAANIRSLRSDSHNFGSHSYMPSGKRINYLVIKKRHEDPPIGIRALINYESIYEEPFEMSIEF